MVEIEIAENGMEWRRKEGAMKGEGRRKEEWRGRWTEYKKEADPGGVVQLLGDRH